MKCVKTKDGEELLTCLYQAINHRIKELHETIDKSQQVTLELVSQIGAVNGRKSKPKIPCALYKDLK